MPNVSGMPSFQLNVLGVDVSFRTQADADRITEAKLFVEEQYELLKSRRRQSDREKLLTLLLLGATDDLLQSRRQLESLEYRLFRLLQRIDDAV